MTSFGNVAGSDEDSRGLLAGYCLVALQYVCICMQCLVLWTGIDHDHITLSIDSSCLFLEPCCR